MSAYVVRRPSALRHAEFGQTLDVYISFVRTSIELTPSLLSSASSLRAMTAPLLGPVPPPVRTIDPFPTYASTEIVGSRAFACESVPPRICRTSSLAAPVASASLARRACSV